MLEDLYRQLQRLLQSDALGYALAAVFVFLWWAVSRLVGILRPGTGTDGEPRPRRRLSI